MENCSSRAAERAPFAWRWSLTRNQPSTSQLEFSEAEPARAVVGRCGLGADGIGSRSRWNQTIPEEMQPCRINRGPGHILWKAQIPWRAIGSVWLYRGLCRVCLENTQHFKPLENLDEIVVCVVVLRLAQALRGSGNHAALAPREVCFLVVDSGGAEVTRKQVWRRH